MTRQKLLAILSTIALVSTAACSDLTAPKNDGPITCPTTGGPDCLPH